MANVSRVKVYQKYKLNEYSSNEDKDKALRGLLQAFRKQCQSYGILNLYKRHEVYEKPSEIKHREKRRKALEIFKENKEKRERN